MTIRSRDATREEAWLKEETEMSCARYLAAIGVVLLWVHLSEAATMPYSKGELVNIGGSGAAFAITGNGYVYGLTDDHTEIWRNAGGTSTSWSKVYDGDAMDGILAGGDSTEALVFRYSYEDGIWKYDGSGTSWTQIGYAGAQWAVINGGELFGLEDDHDGIWVWTGSGTNWTQVEDDERDVLYGRTWDYELCAQHTGDSIYCRVSGSTWNEVGSSTGFGGDPQEFSYATYPTSYGISSSSYPYSYSWTSPGWTNMGWVLSDGVFGHSLGSGAVSRRASSTGYLYRFVSGTTWSQETEFSVQDVVESEEVDGYSYVLYHAEDDDEPYVLAVDWT